MVILVVGWVAIASRVSVVANVTVAVPLNVTTFVEVMCHLTLNYLDDAKEVADPVTLP